MDTYSIKYPDRWALKDFAYAQFAEAMARHQELGSDWAIILHFDSDSIKTEIDYETRTFHVYVIHSDSFYGKENTYNI